MFGPGHNVEVDIASLDPIAHIFAHFRKGDARFLARIVLDQFRQLRSRTRKISAVAKNARPQQTDIVFGLLVFILKDLENLSREFTTPGDFKSYLEERKRAIKSGKLSFGNELDFTAKQISALRPLRLSAITL